MGVPTVIIVDVLDDFLEDCTPIIGIGKMKVSEKKRFENFLSEAKLINDAKGAKYSISEEFENCVVLEGEVIGKDTHEKIINLGTKHGLHVLAQELSVMYRESEIEKANINNKKIH